MTSGAVRPSQRSAPTKVVVFHAHVARQQPGVGRILPGHTAASYWFSSSFHQ
jgi:hypothetical protein